MSNKKQTAVEWLKEQLEAYGNPSYCEVEWSMLDKITVQAKEMEVKANADYFNRGFKQGLKTAIQRIEDEQ